MPKDCAFVTGRIVFSRVPFSLFIPSFRSEQISYADHYFAQFSNGLLVSNLLVKTPILLDLVRFLSEKSILWRLIKKVGPEFAITDARQSDLLLNRPDARTLSAFVRTRGQ